SSSSTAPEPRASPPAAHPRIDRAARRRPTTSRLRAEGGGRQGPTPSAPAGPPRPKPGVYCTSIQYQAAPPMLSPYAELHCASNFTFLRGASHPEELVERAHALDYAALAITDECSLAGVV